MRKNQALQITKLKSMGYFEEPLGPAKILDHYHNFLFFINVTQMQVGYSTLSNNLDSFSNKVESEDKLTQKIISQLRLNIVQINKHLQKRNYKRSKKGIINGLGTVIKFITGNLDNNDLLMINENLESIHNTQSQEIEKINQLTSFANHVSQRLEEETKILNENFNKTLMHLNKMNYKWDIRLLLQSEVSQSENLLNTLLMLERTISMSLLEIPNLEIINVEELLEIYNYLKKVYNPEQLLHLNITQLYKLLENSKLSILGTQETIIFLLKIPILKPSSPNLSKIYPLPNDLDILLTPPKKYLVRIKQSEFWTNEECKEMNSMMLCTQQPSQENCTTQTLSQCTTAKAINNYQIVHVLKNNQLLTSFKDHVQIIEDCDGILYRVSLRGSNIIHSSCRIIIGTSVYYNTTPIFQIQIPNVTESDLQPFKQEINLKLEHLTLPIDLKNEISELSKNRLSVGMITHVTHYTLTSVTVLCVLVATFFIIKYFSRIKELLCAPRTIVHIQNEEN